MKTLLFPLIGVAICLGSTGCEMHPLKQTKESQPGTPTADATPDPRLERPKVTNPNPPRYFQSGQ